MKATEIIQARVNDSLDQGGESSSAEEKYSVLVMFINLSQWGLLLVAYRYETVKDGTHGFNKMELP